MKALRRSALLIGVSSANGSVGKSLSVTAAMDRVATVLGGRFGFAVERCEDEATTRLGMLDRLDAWIADCKQTHVDVALLYYFGHGGRVEFSGLPALEEHEFGYVTCRRVEPIHADGRRPFEGVLGFELSLKLSGLAAAGRSVVAILDCCYAGQLVRSGRRVEPVHRVPAPAWVRRRLQVSGDALAVDSHPDIVRLAGSSPKREGFARAQAGGHIGLMTQALLHTLDEPGEDWPRATWDGIARRVRQRVIDQVGEGQWVSFAGPREQLLFSPSAVAVPRTVGLVADAEAPWRAWLRVGALQGVEKGERWVVTSPLAASEPLARGTVVSVELNRACLEFDDRVDLERLRSNAAHREVEVDDAVASARWLAALSALAVDRQGRHDRELAFAWTWGVTANGPELPIGGARIASDDRIWFRFESRSERAEHWFIHVIVIDAAGRPWQLNTRLAQGIELERGDRELLGLRVGATQQGLRLPFARGPAKLVILAAVLPLEFDHFVRTPDRSTPDAFAMQGLRPSPQSAVRGASRKAPVLLDRWAHQIVDFELVEGRRPQ